MTKARTKSAKIEARHKGAAFYTYSSHNKRGGKMHPLVAQRTNRILDLWAMWATKEEIATTLNIDQTTVDHYLRRARRRGDPRAFRTIRDKARLKADVRRKQISRLYADGMTASQIARQLDVSERLVQIRINEDQNK